MTVHETYIINVYFFYNSCYFSEVFMISLYLYYASQMSYVHSSITFYAKLKYYCQD